jgi:hypothetical protein
MVGRIACVGLCIALLVGCYSATQPDCGFYCGPAGECPDNYMCAADRRCHLDGTPASLVCPHRLDGGVDTHMFFDGPPDAADITSPIVLSTTPTNAATNVAVNTTIVVVFSEPVLNVDDTSFTVTDGTNAVIGTVTANSSTMYTFTPSAVLTAATTYTVTLSNVIRDPAGNHLVTVVFSFQTA